jgi:hypothetical protein
LGVQDAFFEGKKAEEISPRKSTPRTLKMVDQQYPPVISTALQLHQAGSEHQEKVSKYSFRKCMFL